MTGRYSELVNHIIADNCRTGYKLSEMVALAEHYGFERTKGANVMRHNPKHIILTHRDYPDLRIALSFGEKDVKASAAKAVGLACLAVRQRNAMRRDKHYDTMPQWVLDALPYGTAVENGNHSVTFEAGGVVDFESGYTPPARIYMLKLEGKSLAITSIAYPEYSAQYTLSDSIRHREEALNHFMSDLDGKVWQHIASVTDGFDKEMHRLETECGFEMTATQHAPKAGTLGYTYIPALQTDACIVHLHHPLYHLDYDIEQPAQGAAIPDAVMHQLHEIAGQHEACVYAQLDLLQTLGKHGWAIQQVKPNGEAGKLTLTHANGASVSVPTYGVFEMFDMRALQRSIDAAMAPVPIVTQVTHLDLSLIHI